MRTPAFVAEISANHLGNQGRAEDLVALAARCGADAVKLQTYDPKTLVGNHHLKIEEGPWAGRNMVELYEEAWTPRAWHKRLFKLAKEAGILAFSSPFSPEDVDFLEEMKCPIYKIASFEITDLDLIRYAAQTGKPLVISTGMASLQEIESAVDTALHHGNGELPTLLKCTSGYPTPLEECNLATIPDLADYFAGAVKVGLSDHTVGIAAPLAAIALGAVMIEKHLTFSREDGGPDAAFSAEPTEFSAMTMSGRQVAQAIGGVRYGPTPAEAAQLKLRRALWVVAEVVEGQEFTRRNLRSCRPCLVAGLPHLPIEEFLGKRAKRTIQAGTMFSADLAQ